MDGKLQATADKQLEDVRFENTYHMIPVTGYDPGGSLWLYVTLIGAALLLIASRRRRKLG